jgi:hypothetical protein
MALIFCQKHWESGFCLRFSKQIVDAIKSDTLISNDDVALFNIILINDENGEEMLTETYLIMKSEFINMEASDVVKVDSEEAYDRYFNLLPELSGICAKCFKEYKEKHNTDMLGFH